MELLIELEAGKEKVNSFTLASAFYVLCKTRGIDVSTVANMLLLEATNEANQILYQTEFCQRSDTNDR